MQYRLYYWPIPFRGHFVRYALAHVGATWEEPGMDELVSIKSLPADEQPLPFMGPPLLHDREADVWISQMPAVMSFLGERYGLLPGDPLGRALTLKVLCDCVDVLSEVTCGCGATMWTPGGWATFRAERLPRWMQCFEVIGRKYGLTETSGTMLGTDSFGIADLATAALWHTMTDKLPELAPLLRHEAPAVAALSSRVAQTHAIAAMRAEQDSHAAASYCGGEIEKSIRAMLALP